MLRPIRANLRNRGMRLLYRAVLCGRRNSTGFKCGDLSIEGYTARLPLDGANPQLTIKARSANTGLGRGVVDLVGLLRDCERGGGLGHGDWNQILTENDEAAGYVPNAYSQDPATSRLWLDFHR